MPVVDLLLGKPLATTEEDEERVSPLHGVPILGLDALASAAYGPEALLTVLACVGPLALDYLIHLTALIVGILVLVFVSYRQTIDAYPGGGGSYTVAKENLGLQASLVASAALSLDYLLNVAVAISAGVGALVSAVPALFPFTLPLCLALLLMLTLLNLRGVRASGAVFLAPAYAFVAALGAVIAIGLLRTVTEGGHPHPVVAPPPLVATTNAASLWLLVRAFANGCTAMTGVEAVSNGVPIFREPAAKGAKRTLGIIVGILITLLIGIALLCRAYGVGATPPGHGGYQSVLSQLVGAVLGRGPLYYLVIGVIVSVLALSANTSFADFPRLCRLLAIDGYLPEAFAHRGRRLAFSHGIVALAVASGVLLIVFGGVTDALIPLFALGAFLAFTLSQAGMVRHWSRPGQRRWGKLVVNALGALATGITCVVVIASKLTEGAWISLLVVGGLMALYNGVRRHNEFVERATRTTASLAVGPTRAPIAVIPMRRWDAVSLKALSFAIEFAPRVVAVQVRTGDAREERLEDRWHALAEEPAARMGIEPPQLVVLRSEYRRLYQPLIEYVTTLARENPTRQVAVIVPELVELRWYHFFLHTHTASVLRSLLLARGGPQIVIVGTPWYLRDWAPEKRRLRLWRRRALGRRVGAPGDPARS